MTLEPDSGCATSAAVPLGLRLRSTPAVAAAATFALGILLDRLLEWPLEMWALLAACGAILFLAMQRCRSGRLASGVVLACCVTAGAMRHHADWTLISPVDVSLAASPEPTPVRLSGRLASSPQIEPFSTEAGVPSWMRIDRTVCEVDCDQLQGAEGVTPVNGRVLMSVTGHLLHAQIGNRVQVTGQLLRVGAPMNLGMFDYQAYLKSRGIRCVVNVDHPDAVTVLTHSVGGRLSRWRADLRQRSIDALVTHLSPQTAPIAISLLIGDRSLMPEDINRDFAESGTMHLLAISGLHVGILAGLLLMICRLFHLSASGTAALVIVVVLMYAFITDHRPPVLRASVLVITAALAWPAYRQTLSANLLGVCALVVLVLDPSDLFDVGAQLSFLAVIAITCAMRLLSQTRRNPLGTGPLTWMTRRDGGPLLQAFRWLGQGYFVTAAIWLFTLPLQAARFRIVAPVGFLLNVLLIPLVAVCLAFGYLTLLCSVLIPWATQIVAVPFDILLNILLQATHLSAAWSLGHFQVAGPPDWWLVGFYAMLGAMLCISHPWVTRRLTSAGLGLWIMLGLLVPLIPARRDSLRCTFLALGHGCCVVVETPDGHTLLYDAGAFSGAQRGQRIIQSALWIRGVAEVDGVLISHADVDHFNAVPELLRTIPVGQILISRPFLDFSQPDVENLCKVATECDVPVRLVQAGDQLQISPQVEARILHPANTWNANGDNAASNVLLITYAGRTVLLTGDLEDEGLVELLSRPPVPVDVLLSPHHGSLRANPAELGQWAEPQYVVVSGGHSGTLGALTQVYSTARRVLSTATSGAITVEIFSNGRLQVEEFQPPDHANSPHREPGVPLATTSYPPSAVNTPM